MGPFKRKADSDYVDNGDDANDDDYVDDGNDIDDGDYVVNENKNNKNSRLKDKKGGVVVINNKNQNSFNLKYDVSGLAYYDCSTNLQLKVDHDRRPIWITPDNVIILEAFSEFYEKAYDFLIDIAEPETRPEFIHTYRLTKDSLYASSITKSSEFIIKQLNIFCKTQIPDSVVKYVEGCTRTFGKAKLVLKDNVFYVESQFKDILKELLRNPRIRDSRIIEDGQEELLEFNDTVTDQARDVIKIGGDDDGTAGAADDDDDDDDDDELYDGKKIAKTMRSVYFKVARDRVGLVKKCAKEESHYPLLEEYDYDNDYKNPKLTIDLKHITQIRPYQVKSLKKMFGNKRARSGIIVLPCGAGKSLTGVVAATTIKRSIAVMCINNASVQQWKEQFLMWTTINERCIRLFTSDSKDSLPPASDACILITTYTMACHGGHRSESSEVRLKTIKDREWGLIILDEVHVAPAAKFSKVLEIFNAHCKLGLTATLVREDEKIKDLHFLVGPKLYEANWIDLTNQGYLARVQCVEVWCPMTKEFYCEYINLGMGSHSRAQKLLYTMNPRKLRACEFLVKEHLKRGHKIIIFSDDLPALQIYCQSLTACGITVPYIMGATKPEERRLWLQYFKLTNDNNVIGLSSVGDTALDIPEANVVIQVSSHFGSKRQEAQRLGRILRPKPNPTGGYNAFFYSLVSTDTKEHFFAMKRQQYLIDQGYTFKIEQRLVDRADRESVILPMNNRRIELDLLSRVLNYGDDDFDALDESEHRALEREYGYDDEEEVDDGGRPDDEDYVPPTKSGKGKGGKGGKGGNVDVHNDDSTVKRRVGGTLSSLSGYEGVVYTEFDA